MAAEDFNGRLICIGDLVRPARDGDSRFFKFGRVTGFNKNFSKCHVEIEGKGGVFVSGPELLVVVSIQDDEGHSLSVGDPVRVTDTTKEGGKIYRRAVITKLLPGAKNKVEVKFGDGGYIRVLGSGEVRKFQSPADWRNLVDEAMREVLDHTAHLVENYEIEKRVSAAKIGTTLDKILQTYFGIAGVRMGEVVYVDEYIFMLENLDPTRSYTSEVDDVYRLNTFEDPPSTVSFNLSVGLVKDDAFEAVGKRFVSVSSESVYETDPIWKSHQSALGFRLAELDRDWATHLDHLKQLDAAIKEADDSDPLLRIARALERIATRPCDQTTGNSRKGVDGEA